MKNLGNKVNYPSDEVSDTGEGNKNTNNKGNNILGLEVLNESVDTANDCAKCCELVGVSDGKFGLVINNARTPEILAGKIARQIDVDSVAMLSALRDKELIKELGFESAEAMFSIFLPNTYEVYADSNKQTNICISFNF